jgi:hypothetical protein
VFSSRFDQENAWGTVYKSFGSQQCLRIIKAPRESSLAHAQDIPIISLDILYRDIR